MQGSLLALACAAALAGCGGDDPAEPAPPSEAPAEAPQASPLRERLDGLVTELLTERGLDPEVTECALAQLAEDLSDAEVKSAIDQIRNTGAAPPEVIEAAAAAGASCGRP